MKLSPPTVLRSPNWLGDAVMTMPAVASLKAHLGPDHSLAVAAPAKLEALWKLCPFVDQVVPLPEPRRLRATSRRLAEHHFQSALLFPLSLRAALEARLAGIPQTVGYGGRGREWLGVQTVPRRPLAPEQRHQKYDWLHLVAACGARAEEPSVRLDLQLEFTGREGDGVAPIVVCPGAEYGPAKRWPVDRYVSLCQQLISRTSLPLHFMGAAGDAELGRELAQRVPGSKNLCGQTSLQEFIHSLARARLVVCNDSGAMHLAAILGVPTVAIFGSTEPLLTGPLGQSVEVMRHHVMCAPCFLRECPLDFACMHHITPAQVLARCEARLAPNPS